MKPTRIIPPKHYKGAKPKTDQLIVRYCEGNGWTYAYLASGERLLCKWGEEWVEAESSDGSEKGAERTQDKA